MADGPRLPTFIARALRWIGRLLRPLFNPDHQEQTDRVAKLSAQIRALETGVAKQRSAVAHMKTSIGDMKDTLHTIDKGREALVTGQNRLREGLAGVKHTLRHQQKLAGRVLNASKHVGTLHGTEDWARRRLERLASTTEPVIVGPWTGEVGFELLYWAAFVRWAAIEYQLDPNRLIVLSRGGTASWYSDVAARYIDAFDLVGVDQFRTAVADRLKQRQVGGFDRELLDLARQRLSLRRVRLLHPSIMYRLFVPVWKGEATINRVFAFTRHARIEATPTERHAPLPSSYVAVRFYFSSCFPDTPDNRAVIARTLASLSREHDVVLLNPGLRVDDHYDFSEQSGGRIHALGNGIPASQNLAVQTAVLARSSGYVGTYGGYAYLAPLLGRDALAYFSVPNFYVHHLEIAQKAFERTGVGHLTTLDAGTAELARIALAE